MSLLRRWFDPIRSSWFYQKTFPAGGIAYRSGAEYLSAAG